MLMKHVHDLSVLTSCCNFDLKTLPESLTTSAAVQKDTYRLVVLLSLAAIIAAPGNYKDPSKSLQDCMTMFKQHDLFKGTTIPRKLQDMVTATLPGKEASPEKERKEKKDKGEKKEKKHKMKHQHDTDADDDQEEAPKSKSSKKHKKAEKAKKEH